jgi:hypothetical protein
MGVCISLVSKFSQILSKNGFATIKSIKSEHVDRENSRGINPKLIIKLEKSAQFDKLTENISLKNWFCKHGYLHLLFNKFLYSNSSIFVKYAWIIFKELKRKILILILIKEIYIAFHSISEYIKIENECLCNNGSTKMILFHKTFCSIFKI